MRTMKLLMTVVCASAIGSASIEAHSATQSAMAGHGWPNHFDTCFGSAFARMINNCTGTIGSTRLLIVPVQVNATASTSFRTYARASGNGTDGFTTCQAFSIADNGSGYAFSQRVSTSNSSAMQLLNLGVVSFMAGGTLHFECNVAEGGGRVNNVEFW